MKIFDWVHWKFHLNVESHSFSHIKDEVNQNAKKAKIVRSENDMDALLDHVTLSHVHESWKDGLLSIGTFGFETNGHFVDDDEECQVKDDEADKYEEEEELDLMAVKLFKREFVELCLSSDSATKADLSTTVINDDIDTPLLQFMESEVLPTYHDQSLARYEIEQKKKKAERTTLADLFSVEADHKGDFGNSYSGIVHQPAADRFKKSSCRKKHGLSFPKKILSRMADDSAPITKLHKFIKKMVRKKICPEVEGKVHGINSPVNTLKSERRGGNAAAPTQSSFMLQG
ncbi:hypothetical protein NE237_011298 [Protea cynaroides]|uniref:Protein TILLER ANGLE CONTROL 1 n=1 Tax=Protea cynaroides TaxID=273540 RepID=A0A9Q0JXT6_9MAGN|nr:hypothetical protein NE237_011298 [Protea cynaroides]